MASGLSIYLRDFYEANPGHTGGQYLHLRISPSINVEQKQHCQIKSAETGTASERPQLHFKYWSGAGPDQPFHRVIFTEHPKP